MHWSGARGASWQWRKCRQPECTMSTVCWSCAPRQASLATNKQGLSVSLWAHHSNDCMGHIPSLLSVNIVSEYRVPVRRGEFYGTAAHLGREEEGAAAVADVEQTLTPPA